MPENSLTIPVTELTNPKTSNSLDIIPLDLSVSSCLTRHDKHNHGHANSCIIDLDSSDCESKSDSNVNAESDNDNDFSSNSNSNQYGSLDLTEALIAEIEDNEYTCLICTGELGVRSEIWNCESCYRVYHLNCTTAWAEKSTQNNLNLSLLLQRKTPSVRGWSCPSCMEITELIPRQYKCWCRKTTAPKYYGSTPHSCGQTCGQELACGHRCTSGCHPGPHPECCAMGPGVKCFCGEKQAQVPCVVTPYDGWSCGKVCNELLPCGEHRCNSKCHDGLCYDCKVSIARLCYCGETVKDLTCAEKKRKKTYTVSRHAHQTEEDDGKKIVRKWQSGFFACNKRVKGFYDCKVHEYDYPCSPRTSADFLCPLTPKDTDTCHCGATTVSSLLGHARSDCRIPIPSCNQVCNKPHAGCGHLCLYKCHEGECPSCPQMSEMQCRCSSAQNFIVPCSLKASVAEVGWAPKCRRKCTARMHCRRHRCTAICCAHEKSARDLEKVALLGLTKGARILSRSLASFSVLEEDQDQEQLEQEQQEQLHRLQQRQQWPAKTHFASVHICDRVCNNLKSCKNHRCTEPCHTGPCAPCMESSSDDLVCACGRTVVQAPIRCGVELPKCRHPCTKPRSCGHPAAQHECHDDSEDCPKW